MPYIAKTNLTLVLSLCFQHSELYRHSTKADNPPHVFGMADVTYQSMLYHNQNQVRTCLVTNCSTQSVYFNTLPFILTHFMVVLPWLTGTVYKPRMKKRMVMYMGAINMDLCNGMISVDSFMHFRSKLL